MKCPAPYTFAASVAKEAYDGDTVYFIVDRGEGWQNKSKYRLDGCDTPEVARCSAEEKMYGLEAKSFTNDCLRAATDAGDRLIVQTTKSKYGYAAKVWLHRDEAGTAFDAPKLLDEYLIERGMAVPYDGGTKMPWEERKAIMLAAREAWEKKHGTES